MTEQEQGLIKEMPDKETLEEFLRGLHRNVTVFFNKETGMFQWHEPRTTLPPVDNILPKK